jgi:putative ABC transport system permease protein
MLAKIGSSPGVDSAGIAETTPLGGAGESTVVRLPGRPVKPTELPIASYTIVSPGYFETIGTPLLQGRTFLSTDVANSQSVAVVNKAMARAFWPTENPLGKQIALGSPQFPAMIIVGIVADVKHLSLRETAGPEMYVPYTQNPWSSMLIMQVAVRTKGEPRSLLPGIEREIHSIYPDIPIANVATLTEAVNKSVSSLRFALFSVGAFGGLALVLACVGVYGVVSFSVTQRTREIGIRMALGANRSQVFRMILLQGSVLGAAGLSVGLLLAFAVIRTIRAFLFGVGALDAVIYCATCALLLFVTFLGCLLPALRATRINPLVAFRDV